MEDLKTYVNKHRKNPEKMSDFPTYLWSLLKKYDFKKDSDLYKKANISRQHWSLIISGKINPSLQTVIKIVFALHADNHECKYLLKKAGYTLASSSDYSLIIRYCIENKIYNIDDVNEILYDNGFADDLL